MADQNYNYPNYNYNYQTPPGEYTQTTTTYTEESPRRNWLPIALLVFLGIILFLVLAYLLFGGNGAGNNNGTTDENKNVVLQWWGVFLEPEVVQPLIDEYQAQNENVTIEYANRWPEGEFETAQGIYKSELNRLLTENQTAQIPDIFMVHNTWAGDYYAYTKESPEHTLESFNSTYYPAVVDDFAHDGQVHGVPLWMDTLAILYNRGLLTQKAGVTSPNTGWNEFKSLANKIAKNQTGETVAGFSAGTGENVTFSVELLYLLFAQNNVDFLNADDQPTFSTNNDSVDALQFYKSFTNSSTADYSGWSTNFKNDSAAFLEKDVAMIPVTSWRYRQILYYNDFYNLNIDMDVSQIPQLQNQSEPIINWADYWGNMVALNRPNSAASWKFLKWISEPEQLRKLHENEKNNNSYFGFLYPRKDMSNELIENKFLKVFNESLPYARTWHMVKGDEVRSLFRELISSSSTSQSSIASVENDVQLLINDKGNLE